MAIDYLLAVGCEPQRTLGADRLVGLHRARILARAALAQLRADGDERPAEQIAIQRLTRTPGGDDARGVTVADLLAESAPLDGVTGACAACPAQLPQALACHRRIRYPISERVEQWLMSRLPESLATSAGVLLVRGLGELGWDGANAAKLRAAGSTYFESKVAYGVRWMTDTGERIEISSDQLFHMMFMVGTLNPTHCLMLALFLGVIPHDTPLQDLKDGPGRARALAAANVPTESDPDIEQLAGFLRMLAVAARLDVPILVDG